MEALNGEFGKINGNQKQTGVKARNSRFKITVTALLVGALLHCDLSNAATSTNNPAPPPPKQDAVECNAIVVVVVLTVAGIIIYQIVKFCKTHFPPPPPAPAPPPPPPPPTPPTPPNNNVAPMALTPPSPGGGGTNSGDTNQTYTTPAYYWSVPAWAGVTTNLYGYLDTNNTVAYDVSSLNYMDTNGASPALITDFVVFTLPSVQSSSNLVDWSNYTLTCWGSTNGVETLLSDGGGYPVLTNYTPGRSPSITLPFGIWVDPKRQQNFVRLVP